MVLFHACCHGSTHKKQTAWLSTKSVYKALAATCDDSHPHDPWGVRWTDSGWSFDTSQEAAYLPLLAQRAAACMVAPLLPLVGMYSHMPLCMTNPLQLMASRLNGTSPWCLSSTTSPWWSHLRLFLKEPSNYLLI
ncbi:unnamed protein product [Effrenium voratum]|uniref:Uncharacterized protein n=1 Tax=Effrenium voratum TaxID=2562239 RepID=A0AA36J0Y7_9DINO|nr:unnamed protein product [Effrenium voratum]